MGALRIDLPFTIASLNEEADYSVGSVKYDNIIALASPNSLILSPAIGSSRAYIMELTTTGESNDVSNHIQATTKIAIGFSYITT